MGDSGGDTARRSAGTGDSPKTAGGCGLMGSGNGGAMPALSRASEAGWKLLRCTIDDSCSTMQSPSAAGFNPGRTRAASTKYAVMQHSCRWRLSRPRHRYSCIKAGR